MSPLESHLRRLVAGLDAAALEALGSRGLLRRARKDLEQGLEIRRMGESDGVLRFGIESFEVRLPHDGPSAGTCSCPAAGVCRHLLAVVLHLAGGRTDTNAELPPTSRTADPTSTPGEPCFRRLGVAELQDWAGASAFKAGCRLVERCVSESRPEPGGGWRVLLPAVRAEVVFPPGTSLDGAIVIGGGGEPRALVVAAVMGHRRLHGEPMPSVREEVHRATEAPRDRASVVTSCEELLEGSLGNGLSRISTIQRERAETLAMSALGVGLPRLARQLRGLAQEMGRVLARDARADADRLFSRMAEIHALVAALRVAPAGRDVHLVGQARSHYENVGNLDLVGVAAWPWRTASGFEGLTALFRGVSEARWYSWSDSRPAGQRGGFSPETRFDEAGPWEGADSPRQLVASTFRLMRARHNHQHRLSSSRASRVLVTGRADALLERLSPLEDWSALRPPRATHASLGLKVAHPLAEIAVVRPARWGTRHFDPVQQCLRWALLDRQGRELNLEVAFEPRHEPAIRRLEALDPATLVGAAVVGSLRPKRGGITLQPHALLRPGQPAWQIFLDRKPEAAAAAPAPAPAPPSPPRDEDEWEEVEEWDGTGHGERPGLATILDDVDEILLACAESGLADGCRGGVGGVGAVARRSAALGLEALAATLSNLESAPGVRAALRARYVSLLCRSLPIPANSDH